MTHWPGREIPGTFGPWFPTSVRCPKCGSTTTVKCRTWESFDTAYEDDQYRCEHCGKTWWIESADA